MIDFIRKLEKGLKTIDPEISTEKAFELLSEPNISSLIFMKDKNKVFYYITEQEISQSFKKSTTPKGKKAKDIAIKSLIFDYERYKKDNMTYLIDFKNRLTSLGHKNPAKFLVMSNGSPIGLLSDLILNEVPDKLETEFKSKLDIFIDSEEDPKANIEDFYEYLKTLGFDLNREAKEYLLKVLEKNYEERTNTKTNKVLEIPDLTIPEQSHPLDAK